MDLKKIIAQKETELKAYRTTDEEIDFLKHILLKYERGLYDFQKEFLLDIHINKVVFVKKTRQCGYSSLCAAHVFYTLYDSFLSDEPENIGRFIFLSPYRNMNEAFKKTISEFAKNHFKRWSGDEKFFEYLKKHIIYVTPGTIFTHICGVNIEEIIVDEAAFIAEFDKIFYTIVEKAKHIIAVSSLPKEFTSFEKLFNYFEETKPSDVCLLETKWWEVPAFNKNLTWKKYEVEPTIDTEGNVKYDKEAWEKRIADGWIPTSPKYEELTRLLNGQMREFIN